MDDDLEGPVGNVAMAFDDPFLLPRIEFEFLEYDVATMPPLHSAPRSEEPYTALHLSGDRFHQKITPFSPILQPGLPTSWNTEGRAYQQNSISQVSLSRPASAGSVSAAETDIRDFWGTSAYTSIAVTDVTTPPSCSVAPTSQACDDAHAADRQCEICGEDFSRPPDLHEQSRYQFPEEVRADMCETCGERFIFAKDLKRHDITHCYSFVCDLCIKSYTGCDCPSPKGTSCVRCRKRKIKCDGVKPACGSCVRMHCKCSYDGKSEPNGEHFKAFHASLTCLQTSLNNQDELLAQQKTSGCSEPPGTPAHLRKSNAQGRRINLPQLDPVLRFTPRYAMSPYATTNVPWLDQDEVEPTDQSDDVSVSEVAVPHTCQTIRDANGQNASYPEGPTRLATSSSASEAISLEQHDSESLPIRKTSIEQRSNGMTPATPSDTAQLVSMQLPRSPSYARTACETLLARLSRLLQQYEDDSSDDGSHSVQCDGCCESSSIEEEVRLSEEQPFLCQQSAVREYTSQGSNTRSATRPSASSATERQAPVCGNSGTSFHRGTPNKRARSSDDSEEDEDQRDHKASDRRDHCSRNDGPGERLLCIEWPRCAGQNRFCEFIRKLADHHDTFICTKCWQIIPKEEYIGYSCDPKRRPCEARCVCSRSLSQIQGEVAGSPHKYEERACITNRQRIKRCKYLYVCHLTNTTPRDFSWGKTVPHNGERRRKRRKVETELSDTVRAVEAKTRLLIEEIEQLKVASREKDSSLDELKGIILQCKESMSRSGLEMDGSLVQRIRKYAPETFGIITPPSSVVPAVRLTPATYADGSESRLPEVATLEHPMHDFTLHGEYAYPLENETGSFFDSDWLADAVEPDLEETLLNRS